MGKFKIKDGGRYFIKLITILIIYFLAGKLSLSFAFLNIHASAIWLPTGIAFVALLRNYKFWPAIFIGAFLVNLSTPTPPLVSMGIAVGNTLEGLIIAFLTIKFAEGNKIFDKPKNVFLLLIFAIAGCVVSATIGITSLVLGNASSWNEYITSWFTWWVGDLISVFLVAPIVLSWDRKFSVFKEKPIESTLALLSIAAVGFLVFTSFSPIESADYPLPFICILPVLWIAIRLGQQAKGIGIIILTGIALYGTVNGDGPFSLASQNASLIILQIFVGVTIFTGLIITSLVKEKGSYRKK